MCGGAGGSRAVTVVIKNRITDLIYSQDEKIDIKYKKIITLIRNLVL